MENDEKEKLKAAFRKASTSLLMQGVDLDDVSSTPTRVLVRLGSSASAILRSAIENESEKSAKIANSPVSQGDEGPPQHEDGHAVQQP